MSPSDKMKFIKMTLPTTRQIKKMQGVTQGVAF